MGDLNVVGCSPLQRSVASADAIAERFPHAERMSISDLREMCYGSLDGASISQVRSEIGEVARRWRLGETELPVGGADGESPRLVVDRVQRSLQAVLQNRLGRSVLFVCHAHVNKALIASAIPGLGLSKLHDVPQGNCAVNVLDFSRATSGVDASFQVLAVD